MPKQVRLRRGTTAQHSTFTGAEGEVTFDTTKKVLVTHDGVTAGGKPVDGFVKLNPGSPVTLQTISGPLTLTGGDSETYGMACANQAQFGQVIIGADAQVKRLLLMQEGLIYASNMNLNFQTFAGKRVSLTGNVTFSGSGYLYGAYVIVRIVCDGSSRTLAFPSGWKFVGAAAPASIAANKTALLQLWSFGTVEGDVVAQYLVEP
jgi:Major tropism determinant N-terminal domain